MSLPLALLTVALTGFPEPDGAARTRGDAGPGIDVRGPIGRVTFLAPLAQGHAVPVVAMPPRAFGHVRGPWGWLPMGPMPGAIPRVAPTDAPPVDPSAPATTPEPAAPALPEGEDVPEDELLDEREPTEPAPTAPTESSTETKTEAEPTGEQSLDDIFGTDDTFTDVEGVSDGTSGPTSGTATAAEARSKTAKMLDDLEMRFRIVSSAYFDTARVERRGFGRNENRLEFYFAYTPNEHLQIVGDIEPVFFGVAQAQELDDLATQQMLTPFHLESDAAYIALNGVLPKLDIKIGRQVLVWGTADKFNPTSNISPDDLEDRPLFTEPIGNQMVVVDYAPLDDKLWFQGVYVPIFYPALLPPSASAALKDPRAPVPYARDSDRAKVEHLQTVLDADPTGRLEPEVTSRVKTPRARFSNGQSAIKVGTSLGGVDMSFSYFNGRHDIPTPILADAITKDPEEGTGPRCCFESHITFIYPRMQVIGFDFTTQLPFLKNLGLWGEGALFIPQAQDLRIEFPIPVDVTPDDGIGNPVREMTGPGIRSTPYIKATTGFDHTFGKHVYVQLQYLRGFIDEFGADHIGNYAVGGTDLIFFGRHLIFRAFGVVDFPTGRRDDASFVIFPELIVVPPWGSVTFELGSFFLLETRKVGNDFDTKFGQKAAGSSIVFFKVAGAF